MSLGGPNKVEFSLLDDPATIISPGQSTTFTVRFGPATEGDKSAFITIPSNDSDEDPYIINLTTGDAPYSTGLAPVITGPVVTDGGNSYAGAWGDFNNNGYPDLFVANKDQNNCLYQNNGNGTFTRITSGTIVTNVENSFGCAWGDYNNDSYPDLFVANKDENNSLYRNNSDGTFTKITTGPVVTDGGASYSGSWGDYDNDGCLDLFVANWGNDRNLLYHNNGDGTFTKVTSGPVVLENSDSSSGVWFDYDNDGYLDLLVANKNITPLNFLYKNNGDGSFTKITEGSVVTDEGQSQAAAVEDIDNDGDMDVFIANLNQDNFLYINSGHGNNWITIECIGSTSNASAIGTRVKVKTTIGGNVLWQVREISGSTGLGGQSSPRAIFGLGNTSIVDEINIQWPSGTVQTFTNVSANRIITVSEDSGIISGYIAPASNKLSIKSFAGDSKGALTVRYLGISMETIHHLKRCTPSLHCKCSPTQWGFSKEPLAAGGNVENSPVLGYNYNPYESDYEYDDDHGPYAGNGPNEPINGGSLSMNTSISTTQSLQLTTSYYFYSFDNKLMAEYDETGACIREYIYMGDRLIAEYLPQSNQYYYYTTDHINSTHMVTDDNGEKVYYTLFGPYGERIPPLEQVTTYDPQLKFSGKEREPEVEIDYFGARYYDHNSYRFISVDPVINKEEALSNPQLWNLYSYCRNNPITFYDPDGRESVFDKLKKIVGPVVPKGMMPNTMRMKGWEKNRQDTDKKVQKAVKIAIIVGGAVIIIDMVVGENHEGPSRDSKSSISRSNDVENPAQMKKLTKGEIKRLEKAGVDIHELKGGGEVSRADLFKNKKGDIFVKPKSGKGPGDPTGLNIKDF